MSRPILLCAMTQEQTSAYMRHKTRAPLKFNTVKYAATETDTSALTYHTKPRNS
jgi:hypothetical protein